MKRRGHLVGSAFAACVMGVVLYLYAGDLGNADLAAAGVLPRLVAALLLYVAVVVMGALSWGVLLRALGATPAPWAAERQLLISQIGKYIPGNFAQYLGRAAMTINSGVAAPTVGFALVIETAVIVAGGFLAVALAVALAPSLIFTLRQMLPDASRPLWLAALAASFLLLVIGASLASGRLSRRQRLPRMRLSGLLLSMLLCTTSFLLLGVSFHLIVDALSLVPAPFSVSVTVFAAAWIAGLVTPGAPGGLGVRESVLTLGLAPFVGGAAALAAALLYRGISVFGDVVALAVGLRMPNTVVAAHDRPAIV